MRTNRFSLPQPWPVCIALLALLLCPLLRAGEESATPPGWRFVKSMPNRAVIAAEFVPGPFARNALPFLTEAAADSPSHAGLRQLTVFTSLAGSSFETLRFAAWPDENPVSFQLRGAVRDGQEAIFPALVNWLRGTVGKANAGREVDGRFRIRALPDWPLVLESLPEGIFLHTARAGDRFAERPADDLAGWAKAMAAAEPESEDAVVWLRCAFFADRLPDRFRPMRVERWKRLLELTGFDAAAEALFLTLAGTGDGLVLRGATALRGNVRRLLPLCYPPATASSVMPLPAEAALVWRMPLGLAAAFDAVEGVEAAFDPAVGAEFREEMKELDAELGFAFRNDFLALFPHGVQLYGLPPEETADPGGANAEDWALRAPCANAESAEALLRRWTGTAGWTVRASEDGRRAVLDAAGAERMVYSLGDGALQLAPTATAWRRAFASRTRSVRAYGTCLHINLPRLAAWMRRRETGAPWRTLLHELTDTDGALLGDSWREGGVLRGRIRLRTRPSTPPAEAAETR